MHESAGGQEAIHLCPHREGGVNPIRELPRQPNKGVRCRCRSEVKREVTIRGEMNIHWEFRVRVSSLSFEFEFRDQVVIWELSKRPERI